MQKKPQFHSIAKEFQNLDTYKSIVKSPASVLKVKGYQGEYFKNSFLDNKAELDKIKMYHAQI